LSSWYNTHPISSVFAFLSGAELKTKAASAEKFQELEVAAEEKDREPVAGAGEGQDEDQVEGQRSRRLLRDQKAAQRRQRDFFIASFFKTMTQRRKLKR
jgi:hypothetical protein